jgi:hypothetical protein
MTPAVLLQLLGSVLEPKSCAYVAGPLESGKTHYESSAAGSQSLGVRLENEKRLSDFVLGLRNRLTYPVFNSGLLRVPSWKGRDYGAFFLDVIRGYARECWFLDGWEYSTGATKEFVFSCAIGVPCFAESGEFLTVVDGVDLVRNAAEYVRGLQLDNTKLRSRVDDLTRLLSV